MLSDDQFNGDIGVRHLTLTDNVVAARRQQLCVNHADTPTVITSACPPPNLHMSLSNTSRDKRDYTPRSQVTESSTMGHTGRCDYDPGTRIRDYADFKSDSSIEHQCVRRMPQCEASLSVERTTRDPFISSDQGPTVLRPSPLRDRTEIEAWYKEKLNGGEIVTAEDWSYRALSDIE